MIRKNVHIIFSLLFLLVIVSSCCCKYRIEGISSITNLDGKNLQLREFQNGDWVIVDSSEIVHGLFTMEGFADSAKMIMLYNKDEPIMPLVLEAGKIEVSLANSQWTAKGIPLNNLL